MYFAYVADILDFIQTRLNKEKLISKYKNLDALRKRVTNLKGISQFIKNDKR